MSIKASNFRVIPPLPDTGIHIYIDDTTFPDQGAMVLAVVEPRYQVVKYQAGQTTQFWNTPLPYQVLLFKLQCSLNKPECYQQSWKPFRIGFAITDPMMVKDTKIISPYLPNMPYHSMFSACLGDTTYGSMQYEPITDISVRDSVINAYTKIYDSVFNGELNPGYSYIRDWETTDSRSVSYYSPTWDVNYVSSPQFLKWLESKKLHRYTCSFDEFMVKHRVVPSCPSVKSGDNNCLCIEVCKCGTCVSAKAVRAAKRYEEQKAAQVVRDKRRREYRSK